MTLRTQLALLMLVLSVGVARAVAAPSPPRASDEHAERRLVSRLHRLSLELRGRRLTPKEQAETVDRLKRASAQAIYEEDLDRWLAAVDSWSELQGQWDLRSQLQFMFLGMLSVYRDPVTNDAVYFLPHTLPASHVAGSAPCEASDVQTVHPWWAIGESIHICRASYKPDHVFDDKGFCGGHVSNIPNQPPRAECGCGSILIACLPPKEVLPHFASDLRSAISAEVVKTADDVIKSGRPFSDLWSLSRTWQPGLVRYMYLRRELLTQLRSQPYSASLERQVEARVRQIDLTDAGKWIERDGIYRGTGLFTTTIYAFAGAVSYRELGTSTLGNFLCVAFDSVHVDSNLLLQTVGKGDDFKHIRALAPWDSKMRTQPGCQGCHGPMDSMTGFFAAIEPAINGSALGEARRSALFVQGAKDFRGEATGFAGLSGLIVRQPEFDACVVKNAFARLLGRSPRRSETAAIEAWTKGFTASHESYPSLVRSILASDNYLTNGEEALP